MKPEPEPPPLRIGTPCPKQWDQMTGDAKRRFCEHCQLHVHNLSAMSPRERRRLEGEAEAGRPLCIAYHLHQDGTMKTASLGERMFRPLQRVRLAAIAVLATFLPFLFSACHSQPMLGKMCPVPPRSKDGSPPSKPDPAQECTGTQPSDDSNRPPILLGRIRMK